MIDLDKYLEDMREKALLRGEIDVFENSENFLTLIYDDIDKETERLKKRAYVDSWDEKKHIKPVHYVDYDELIKYDNREFIDNLYRKILGREPDSEGLKTYADLLEREHNKEKIIAIVAFSKEAIERQVYVLGAKAKCLNSDLLLQLNGEYFINNLYYWLLGRCPDISGFESNLKCLNEGGAKISILKGFINSEEFKSRDIKVLGLKKKYYQYRLKQVLRKIPIVGSIGAFTINILKANKRIIELAIRCDSIERELGRLDKCYNDTNYSIRVIESQNKTNLDRIVKLEDSMEKVKPDGGELYTWMDYIDFENHFRGSREHVKSVQEQYLRFYQGRSAVVDFGCGRGEFLEILAENGIGAIGVDTYEPYVKMARDLGLKVKNEDGIKFMRTLDKVDGVFASQVVEHMKFSEIIELFTIAYEKMIEGAYIIVETPNPTSLAIYTECFYMDPTHIKPIHPFTLKYIAEKVGFSEVSIYYSENSKLHHKIPCIDIEPSSNIDSFNEAMKRVESVLYGSQDYAIIAKK